MCDVTSHLCVTWCVAVAAGMAHLVGEVEVVLLLCALVDNLGPPQDEVSTVPKVCGCELGIVEHQHASRTGACKEIDAFSAHLRPVCVVLQATGCDICIQGGTCVSTIMLNLCTVCQPASQTRKRSSARTQLGNAAPPLFTVNKTCALR